MTNRRFEVFVQPSDPIFAPEDVKAPSLADAAQAVRRHAWALGRYAAGEQVFVAEAGSESLDGFASVFEPVEHYLYFAPAPTRAATFAVQQVSK